MKKEEKNNTPRTYSAPSAVALLDTIEAFCKSRRPYSMRELARYLHLSTNMIFRILWILKARGYVDKINGEKFMLSRKFFALAESSGKNDSISTVTIEPLKKLADTTRETAHLTILHGNRQLLLAEIPSPDYLKLIVTPGNELYLHASAFGKILLAGMSGLERKKIYHELPRLTGNTLTTQDRIEKEISIIKKQGYALDSEEYTIGIRCLGSFVLDSSGKCIASAGIVGLVPRLTNERLRTLVKYVKIACIEMSRALGANKNVIKENIKPESGIEQRFRES